VFKDDEFVGFLNYALYSTKAATRDVYNNGGGTQDLGVAILEKFIFSGYKWPNYINRQPNRNAARGLEVGSGGLKNITNAAAVVISVGYPWQSDYILSRSGRYLSLSDTLGAPVIVTGNQAGTYVFDYSLSGPILLRDQ
jgi:hypothetical protein